MGYYRSEKSKNHAYNSKGLQLVKERLGQGGQFNIQALRNSEGAVAGTLATLVFNLNNKEI